MPVPAGDLVSGYYWALLKLTYATVHIRKHGDPDRSVLCTNRNNILTLKWMGESWKFDKKRMCNKCYGLYLLELMGR